MIALCVTGGLDSYLAWRRCVYDDLDVVPLWVDLGHPYADDERAALRRQGIPFTEYHLPIMRSPDYCGTVDHIVPGRNTLLAAIAASFGDRVWICSVLGERHPFANRDKSDEWELQTSATLSYSWQPVRPVTRVESPWARQTKAEVVRYSLGYLDVAVEDIALTSTCYAKRGGLPCGECVACLHRYIAMRLNGIYEQHAVDPKSTMLARREYQRCQLALHDGDFTHIVKQRAQETVEVLAP